MKIKQLCLYSVLSAMLILAQLALAPLPNIELVSMLVILYALLFGFPSLFIVGAFVLVEGLIFGFGIWWLTYLYVWPLLTLLTLILKKYFKNSRLAWAFFSGLFGLIFGSLTAIPYFFMGGVSFGFSYIISGVYFDLLHAGGNFIVSLLLLSPCIKALQKLLVLFQMQNKSTP